MFRKYVWIMSRGGCTMSKNPKYRYTTPISMPRGTHYGNNYHIMPSRKLSRNVCAYSNLEYENLLCLEMNPEVEFYCEQPVEVSVMADGESHKTTFDVYVYYRSGNEEMQEVKYYDELHSDSEKGLRDQKQIKVQKIWCESNQIDHLIQTDREIEKGEFTIRNIAWLAAKARRVCVTDKEACRYILSYLTKHDFVTIGMLYEAGMLRRSNGLDVLADLAYRGKIRFTKLDSEVISNASEVTLYGK